MCPQEGGGWHRGAGAPGFLRGGGGRGDSAGKKQNGWFNTNVAEI